jgi:hypothetical protein
VIGKDVFHSGTPPEPSESNNQALLKEKSRAGQGHPGLQTAYVATGRNGKAGRPAFRSENARAPTLDKSGNALCWEE